MLDIRFVRENPEIVKENIKKKFQDAKLPLVDEVIALDTQYRAAITEASELRAMRNQLSKANGPLFGKLKKAAEDGAEVTDDCSAVERLGMTVKIVDGDERNLKVTTPIDLKFAEMLMEENA